MSISKLSKLSKIKEESEIIEEPKEETKENPETKKILKLSGMVEQKEPEPIPNQFWGVKKTKDSESYYFDSVALANVLSKAGFGYGFMLKANPLEQTLLRVEGATVAETTIKIIQKYAQSIIENSTLETFAKNEILALWKRQHHFLVCENTINLLPYFSTWKREPGIVFLDMLEDTKDQVFFPFLNGVVEISKNGIALKPYSKYVWKSQIILRIFTEEDQKEIEQFDFFRFLQNICKGKIEGEPKEGEPKEEEEKKLDNERFQALRCAIGYLLHDYKRSWNKKAVILSEASLDDDPQGRTGKGLILQAIGKLRKVITIDGRLFRFDSQFCYQNVTLDTKIIFFDDVHPKFDFRKLYSAITEGLSFEKKGKERVNLPVEESPKIALSTNYAIKGNSESDKGRKIEIELLCYYSTKFKPVDEFKRNFFSDEWDGRGWNVFYNVMFGCVKEYFKNDCEIPEYKSNVLQEKRLNLEIGKELVDFLDTILEENPVLEISCKSLFESFLIYIGENEKKTSWKLAKFTKAVNKYCKEKKIISGYERKKNNGFLVYTFSFSPGMT